MYGCLNNWATAAHYWNNSNKFNYLVPEHKKVISKELQISQEGITENTQQTPGDSGEEKTLQ